MKAFVVASSEYKANWPDMFVMTEDGTYYGVSEVSYAKIRNFPKEICYWKNANSSDSDRGFFIDEVELDEADLVKFDEITREYYRLESEKPKHDEPRPERESFKTSKDYNKAIDEYIERYMSWFNNSGARETMTKRENLWVERVKMFLSFSDKVASCISSNDNIKYL